ncbi:Major sperm protein [Caenorhabditis elegans]|uniref:Major sperm protein n=1 Tax=Caenorhabditis elegans TaxID=6239 RepID=A0A7R9SUH3_CAEEL|nr:Major sperm protein [Caenorhabditis elegans]CAD8108532.1 Major sperm protein [Caenorhabditis elegans]
MEQSNGHKLYVVLDQTFVCFDIDQPKNACQKLKLNSLAGVGPIYWRFLTNAPTRYFITPNQAVLRDDEPIEVCITLYQNKFRPRHEIVLQAASIPECGDFDPKKLFDSPENVQSISLDLGTTIMKIESAVEISKTATDFHTALDASSVIGSDRVDQLKSILNLTKSDTALLESNITQAKQLKITLDAQLQQRKALVDEYKSKLTVLEGSYMRKSAEVQRLQNELQNAQKAHAMKATTAPNEKNQANCSIS